MSHVTDTRREEAENSEFELERIEKLYLMGNFNQVRRRTKRLLGKELTPEQRTAAKNLLAATGIDPVAVAAFILTASALAAIVVLYAN